MTLSDRDIKAALELGELVITPLAEGAIQPASVDLHLDPRILVRMKSAVWLDLRFPQDKGAWEPAVIEEQGIWLFPDRFYLASTVEKVRIPADMLGRIEGKSSLARSGLLVHCTAGFIDPGFGCPEPQQITLEIKNLLGAPIRIYAGMPISQLAISRLSSPAERPYAGKYQNQDGPRVSEYWRNFKEAK